LLQEIDGTYAVLLDFLLLALVLLWLVVALVRLWREARAQFIRQHSRSQ
jgi:hypothetical protein